MTTRPQQLAVLGDDGTVAADLAESLPPEVVLSTEPGEADLVVVGPAAPEPIRIAQQVGVGRPDVPVLLLCPPDQWPRIREEVLIAPLLGRIVQCEPFAEGDAAVADVVLDLLHAAARQRTHRATARAAGERVERPDPADGIVAPPTGTRAGRDPLTGIPDRTAALDRLTTLLHRVEPTTVTVAFVDLDRFKGINDTRGHGVGDEVLLQLAQRLGAVVRSGDLVARLGGDEFVVIAQDVDDRLLFGQRLAGVFDEPVDVEGGEVVVAGSIGVASGWVGSEPADLLRNADHAMYQAKQRNETAVVVADEAVQEGAGRHQRLLRDLPGALSHGQILPALQPVVRLPDRSLVGVEILARWHHPQLGILPAREFLPIAVQQGLAATVGRQVAEEGLARTAALRPPAPLREITVNMSLQELQHDTEPVIWLQRACQRLGLSGSQLWLDLSAADLHELATRDPDRLVRLRVLGAQVALEGARTDVASLEDLHRLAPDRLKLDLHPVGALPAPAHRRALVRAVAEVGRALGIQVAALGLADDAMATLAQGAGFVRGQGRLFPSDLLGLEAAGSLS